MYGNFGMKVNHRRSCPSWCHFLEVKNEIKQNRSQLDLL